MSHIELIESILVIGVAAGLLVTAKDFYKLRAEIFDTMDKKYVLKEVHSTDVTALRSDIEEIKTDTKGMSDKIDKIYTFLLCNYNKGVEHVD